MLDNINGFIEYDGDYKKLEKDLNVNLISIGRVPNKSKPNQQSYSLYRLYKYEGLSIKYFEQHYNHGRCIYISGSIRKYFCKVNDISNINYDLSRKDINSIITNFKSLNINLTQLELESFEWGLTVEYDGDLLSKLVSKGHFTTNAFADNSVEFIGSRTKERYKGRKLIFYKPEVSEKIKTVKEPTDYLRVEFNLPNRTANYLKLKEAFGASERLKLKDFTCQEVWGHVFEYLKDEIKNIKCTKKIQNHSQLSNGASISKTQFVSAENYYTLQQYIEKYKTTKTNITPKEDQALDNFYRTILKYENNGIKNDTDSIDELIDKLDEKYNMVNV